MIYSLLVYMQYIDSLNCKIKTLQRFATWIQGRLGPNNEVLGESWTFWTTDCRKQFQSAKG